MFKWLTFHFVITILVSKSKYDFNTGVCVIKYAVSLCKLSENDLLEKSFEFDQHKSFFSSWSEFSFNDSDLSNLRGECLKLICNISEKYFNSRDMTNDEVDNDSEDYIGSTCTHYDDFSDDTSSTSSTDSCSVFVPEYEIEKDENDSVHDESSDTCAQVDNDHDVSINSSMEYNCSTGDRDNDKELKDNLVCPGDVIEYKTQHAGSHVQRSSVVTIQSSKETSSVVLKNGAILHSKNHMVRKVKFYCTRTGTNIPNPFAEWYHLHNCILQVGTLMFDYQDTCDAE